MAPTLLSDQKLSPMMEQYRSIKETLPPETVLFFRLGDFYEMFFEDAERASEILNITLTGRDAGEIGRVPMCGVPYHSYQVYARTLLDHNLKVAICEQIGDPRVSRGLVERKVTRILTPATYLDEDAPGATRQFLAAVAIQGDLGAIAYLDLSTGEFYVREVPAARLTSELSLLSAREMVLSNTIAQDSHWMSWAKDALGASLTVYEDWVFDPGEGSRLLQETFALGSEKAVAFHDRPLAVSAAGAVLYYLKDHLQAGLKHLAMPRLLEANEFMVLDRQTVASLELVGNVRGKARSASLLSVIDQTVTAMGARTLSKWLAHPLLSVGEIERRLGGVEELARAGQLAQSLALLLKGIRDMERTLSRLSCGIANGRDLVHLKTFLTRVPELKTQLARAHAQILLAVLASLQPFVHLKDLIERAIVSEPPLGLKEGGIIRDGFSRSLDLLRDIARKGKSWILDFQRREIERTGIKSLRIKYSQVFGYGIEVSKPNLHLVPPDYTRKQTLANAERFTLPELSEWDEKISGAEEKVKQVELELFNGVREKVLEDLAPLQEMARAMGILDAVLSLALTASRRNWVRPQVVESTELLIEGGRHPVVEATLPAGQFVENDTALASAPTAGDLASAEAQLLVLTGPNMAGKSTYIRQVALIVLLAQMGSFVPARRARVGLVDRIFTRIGASDDLAQGESTFMVEMLETAHILRSATQRSLLVLDEVGRGTSTFDGVSIAWAVCEYLASGPVRPRTLFATHYHELTQLEAHFPAVKNYTITVRETGDGIVFLRKVVRGGSDRSYGIHVARLAGIPPEVTARANQILSVLERESGEVTRIIEGREAQGNVPTSGLPADAELTADPSTSPGAPAAGTQLELFRLAGGTHPVLEEILGLAIDDLTPLAALNRIAAWREQLKNAQGGLL